MKLGVISDTHGSFSAWEQVMKEYFYDCDLILHAGDILYHGPRNPQPDVYDTKKLAKAINDSAVPLVIASGNCDSSVDQLVLDYPIQQPYAFVQWDNKQILINHGDKLTDADKEKMINLYGLDYLICGHTHIPEIRELGTGLVLNPGSPALPKYKNIKTAAIIGCDGAYIIDIDSGERLFTHGLVP